MKSLKHIIIIIMSIQLLLVGCSLSDVANEIESKDIMYVVDRLLESIEDTHDIDTERIEGTVTYIVDGDTFDIVTSNGEKQRVRPILIDTPEICHKNSPKDCKPEPYGEKAKEFTNQLLNNQTVYLEQDVQEKDRYDRYLYYVYLEDGTMFQELLVEKGLAQVKAFPPDVKHQVKLEQKQKEAQNNKVGIWSN